MTMLSTLTDWYLRSDRIGKGVIVLENELRDVIRYVAKMEGRESGIFPWESGAEYDLRMGAHKE